MALTRVELKNMLGNVEDEARELWRNTTNGSLEENVATVLRVTAQVLQSSLKDTTDDTETIPKIRTT